MPGTSEVEVGRSRGWLRLFAGALGPLVTLAIVYAAFGIIERFVTLQQGRTSTFLEVNTLRALAEQMLVVAVAALGMTLIIISGGIDLSAGTTLALSAVATAVCFRAGYDMPWPLVAAVGVAAAVGAINGLLITSLRLVPFIVTLGMMSVAVGIAKGIAGSTTVEGSGAPPWISRLVYGGFEPWLVYPLIPNFATGIWVLAAMSVLLALVLRYTVFGRYVFAVGSSEATARLCGINVAAVKIGVYALAGVFVGIAGVLQFARLRSGDPTGGAGLELRIIAAVVVGGGSLSGGRGTIVGTIAGAAVMAVIAQGCSFLNISSWIQDIVIGSIIAAAAAFDQFRRRRLAA
jgi:ribose transport system permease protein